MNQSLVQIAKRRQGLIAQAARQRSAIAADVGRWRLPLAVADHGITTLRFIKQHPLWLTSAGIMIAAIDPDRAGKWFRRAWATWQLVRALRDY